MSRELAHTGEFVVWVNSQEDKRYDHEPRARRRAEAMAKVKRHVQLVREFPNRPPRVIDTWENGVKL